MRYVYLVEKRELNNDTNRYEYHNSEVFSSLKKAEDSIDNSMLCNKAYAVKVDNSWLTGTMKMVSYTTLGWGANDARVEMRLRLLIKKVELK